MSEPLSTADIARATLHRLTDLGLSPTPDNYSLLYYEIACEEQPDCTFHADQATGCTQLMQLLRSVVESVTDKTAGLASDLSEHNREMRQSIDELALTDEKEAMLRLLGAIVTKTDSIHSTVEISHEDLLATRLALKHVKNELQETRVLLHEDALTGAKNRGAMDAVLAREVTTVKRTGARFTVVMIDIDHFKGVNDKYGHDAGDKLLLHLTVITKSVLREADVLVRYGGGRIPADIAGHRYAGGGIRTGPAEAGDTKVPAAIREKEDSRHLQRRHCSVKSGRERPYPDHARSLSSPPTHGAGRLRLPGHKPIEVAAVIAQA